MYKVFLVEDETPMCQLIRDTIDWNKEGFEFCGDAPDGESALPLLLEKRPDIIITDIRMPFMDGFELVRIINKELPEAIVIILSGHDEFTYAQRAISLGISDYILKPVTPTRLIRSLVDAVKKKEDKQDEVRKQVTIERSRQSKALALDEEEKAKGGFRLFMVERNEIEDLLRFGGVTDVEAYAAKTAYRCYKESGGSTISIIYCILDVLVTAHNIASDMGINLPQIESFERIANEVNTEERFSQYIKTVFLQIIDIRYSMADKTIQLIHSAKNYVNANYEDCNLSLNVTAENIGVSANYLSTIFSKESGETFIEYLNNIRIKSAMAMLKSTNLRVAEISDKVGYNDPRYFSKIFKKVIGLSPQEYKKM